MENEELAKEHITRIKSLSKGIGNITIMEICGGHTNVILKYGIRDLLPSNIRLISGPGCPVCVSAQYDIDCIIELANHVPVATYGDMLRIPGQHKTLEDAPNVYEVYSATEVLKLRNQYPDIVFFGVGFETTAPMSAYLLSQGVCVYSVHKLVPPAMKSLIIGKVAIDGFINPGHVSTIIGSNAYDMEIPQAIAGFSPEKVLRALSFLIQMIKNNNNSVVNAYPEAVTAQGNIKAQKLMNTHMQMYDADWRGLGTIPGSGLETKDPKLNAKKLFGQLFKKIKHQPKTECRCGDVLRGLIEPSDCTLFKKSCNPDNPQGACMVSAEGSCAIYYQYGK